VKAPIVDSLNVRVALSKTRCVEVLESLLEITKKCLENGEDVMISGFGKFCVKENNFRVTGTTAERIVIFKCSPVLIDRMNPDVP
jgi:integration host factor subunit alpha